MASSDRPSQKFFGILIRKERWGLSWRSWLTVVLLGILTGVLLLLTAEPFLAETHRVNSETLVVEGWIHEYAIRAAVEEFRRGSYQHVLSTGGPVVGNGGYVNDYQTSASVGADELKKRGVPSQMVQMVPSRIANRDRTYAAAVALREWFLEHDMTVNSLNVLTEDTHARRTHLLFEKALGKNVAVGIIAVPNPDYDAQRWWKYSEGVKDVVGEGIAYLYARLFFIPWKSANQEKATQILQAYH